MCLSFDLQRETKGSCNLYTLGLTSQKSKNIWQNGNGKIAKLCWPSRLRHYYLAELFSQVDVVVQTLSVEISVMCVYPSISNEKLWALVTFTALGPTINKIRFSAKSLKNLWQNKNWKILKFGGKIELDFTDLCQFVAFLGGLDKDHCFWTAGYSGHTAYCGLALAILLLWYK